MALNYVVSYTFSPSTTISSSQVNTNFSDNANTWNGLEALTKSFAKLKVDSTPATANEVAIKSYVDSLMLYRRPVLVYSSSTVVNIQTGNNGVSGQVAILFPDGNLRTDSTSTRINCDLSRVAALSGSWQSGLRTGTVGSNAWYAIYAVKTSDDTAKIVAVADQTLPLVANVATLNSNYGTNSWVYLGLIRTGDNSGATTAILSFVQNGNTTAFKNTAIGATVNCHGILMATSASASTVTYSYAAGTAAAQIPDNIGIVNYLAGSGAATGATTLSDSSAATSFVTGAATNTNSNIYAVTTAATDGAKIVGATTAHDIYLTLFVDGVLGVGSNPLL